MMVVVVAIVFIVILAVAVVIVVVAVDIDMGVITTAYGHPGAVYRFVYSTAPERLSNQQPIEQLFN